MVYWDKPVHMAPTMRSAPRVKCFMDVVVNESASKIAGERFPETNKTSSSSTTHPSKPFDWKAAANRPSPLPRKSPDLHGPGFH
jgi:hypothetical protein